jgi:hypothetical protein
MFSDQAAECNLDTQSAGLRFLVSLSDIRRIAGRFGDFRSH